MVDPLMMKTSILKTRGAPVVGRTDGLPGADGSGEVSDIQLLMSPYYGKPDFSELANRRPDRKRLDLVSMADLLRNGFVCPPHSVLEDVKLVTFGFDPQHDMHGDAPQFRFIFRERDRVAAQVGEQGSDDWVATYHRLLCDAVTASCRDIRSPWLLQSGGKDSTSIAIAAAEARPDTTCITYLGGREENEVASAQLVANTLGLRHETLVCDPGRAFDRYLAMVTRMPLVTADFSLLSYVDLATTVSAEGGDGVIDGMGSDNYFGIVVDRKHRWLSGLARGMRLPRFLSELPLLGRNFELSYLLSTLQMDPIERVFPGSRFTDAEVDALFGRPVTSQSKGRLALFQAEIDSAKSIGEWWAIASSIAGSAGAFGKGLFTTSALSMRAAYPFCDPALREWVYRKVPLDQVMDMGSMTNKVLMRKHIATRFGELPYVARKGSFRFDLCGLAQDRFEQVHAYAVQSRDVLPGAVDWLERNRGRLDNKYHASKFYLLAVVLPWIAEHGNTREGQRREGDRRESDRREGACLDSRDEDGREGADLSLDGPMTMKLATESRKAAIPRRQITMSPYFGRPDFSGLIGDRTTHATLDPVSVADLLRNGFIYAPHSIFENVKLATFGFNPQHDMHGGSEFRFQFPDSGKSREHDGVEKDWVQVYHQLLCDAVTNSCRDIRSPWLLQSGGKDSTSIAIAAAEARPDTTCITYLGGREENEIASARSVARTLGLRHEILVCDPGRAYDRYLAVINQMPLLTADFALLSYVDLATAVSAAGGDGVIDGLGSDSYFGMPVNRQHRVLSSLAKGIRLPSFVAELPLIDRSFKLCFGLSTLQMDPFERIFPGSRFTDTEVDELFGRDIARQSKARLAAFRSEIDARTSLDELRTMAITIEESASAFAKGLYITSALSLTSAYPFCDGRLREWVYRQVPPDQLVDPVTRASKVLVRKHIATRFEQLPYVSRKGSFRFNLCGLAKERFDQVHGFAEQGRDVLPGAIGWLERNRGRLDNKYHASKFYLLAIVLPWIAQHGKGAALRS
jgi:asparagine synthetase B (glutamine-hydrolysing)